MTTAFFATGYTNGTGDSDTMRIAVLPIKVMTTPEKQLALATLYFMAIRTDMGGSLPELAKALNKNAMKDALELERELSGGGPDCSPAVVKIQKLYEKYAKLADKQKTKGTASQKLWQYTVYITMVLGGTSICAADRWLNRTMSAQFAFDNMCPSNMRTFFA
jgi:hypothetical protein